jgi:hypothetical protein
MERDFTDIMQEFGLAKGKVAEKVKAVAANAPNVSIYAVGGFPICRGLDDSYTLMGNHIDTHKLAFLITEGLGLSGVMTYGNPKYKTLHELGEACRFFQHDWAFNWVTISLLIANQPAIVEKSFLRHNKFYESWTVGDHPDLFGISGSIKDFKKYSLNYVNESFDAPTRAVMKSIHDKFSILWR